LKYGSENTKELLYTDKEEGLVAAQIFGSDPAIMREVCEGEDLALFPIIDINMGCPVPNIYKNGEGSALLEDIKRAESIIKECVKSQKIITVKIRIGLKHGDDIAREFAMMAENAGASLITIHGRVREDYYSGEPNYNAIYKAKKSVSIPVIANGGIFTKKDAEQILKNSGADGVMLARGAIADPFLVNKLLDTDSKISLKEYIIEHVQLMKMQYEDKKAAHEFRKFTPYYFKGMTGVKELKLKLQQAESTDEILQIIKEHL
jgi:nifR3 family TIM-barrel protein